MSAKSAIELNASDGAAPASCSEVELDRLTPIEALNFLAGLKKRLET